jgi:peptidoglycan/LPS O-acetylase OafA/YrhL
MSDILKKKRNFFVPYIKGWAIISIILIHLIDWSDITVSGWGSVAKEILYPAVLFFIANAGSVIYIAYNHYDLPKATKKLFMRGIELIGIYFIYNIVKFFIFDFSTEPFYDKFNFTQLSDIGSIFSLQAFTAPISILLTIGILLLIAPALLYIVKKSQYPKTMVALLLVLIVAANWFLPHPHDPVSNFLYAEGNIMFPLALWLVPFILGFLVAQLDFEKYAKEFLALFLSLTGLTMVFLPAGAQFFRPSWNMYPLTLYYIFLSFAFMYLLIFIFKILGTWKLFKKPLALVRFLGDMTLSMYIYHWIVLDLTLWFFFPTTWVIWITVPAFIVLYTYSKREVLTRYYAGEL